MLQIIIRLAANIIEIFFVTLSLTIVQKERYKLKDFFICIGLYLPSYFLLKEGDWRIYIIKNMYLFLIFILYLLKIRAKIKKYVPLVCAILSIYSVFKVLISVISIIITLFIVKGISTRQIVGALLSLMFMCIVGWGLTNVLKDKSINLDLSFSNKCMICFIYVITICIKIPFLYTDIRDAFEWKAISISIICCTVIFFIISRIERHNAEMERAKIEENNKELSTKLHKSQEIIPAVVQVLSDVAESSGKEMEEQKTQKLLNEMSDLFGQQLKENSKEDLHLKNFCSTGLTVLDHQLKGYQMEAIDRGVNLDIYVQAPINDIIKRNSIDQLKLQRAVGDLIRNAFRVIINEKRSSRTNGHILLIIGCQYEGILEIAVVDNGAQFPLHVIETFGRRGVTTGGTGNGLADLVEFAEETKATICVEEFDGKTDSFTKKISMIFDKQRENIFISPRWEQVNSSFWKKLNIDL